MITNLNVEAIEIPSAVGMDPIQVYFVNIEPGVGHVTITYFGSAWTAYFGAMSGKTIQNFFLSCDVGYLTNKLGNPRIAKKEMAHLTLIVKAIQEALRQAVAA